MKFVKLALAAIAMSSIEATTQRSATDLVSQALLMTKTGTEAHEHLTNAISVMNANNVDARSQVVHVPIDEKRDLTLKVSPTYQLDIVNSVTLKSFRKIVGYDTFESIRKKNRSESKDISDYYNVTVSMMIQRKPVEAAAAPAKDPYNPDGNPSLAASLDKGFPYDD
jgi:hypothetical protein